MDFNPYLSTRKKKRSMSFYSVRYHVVLPTYMRQPTIKEENEQKLYAYIKGIAINLGGMVYVINGMPDHVHMLVNIPPSVAVSDFIKKVKQYSSKWMRESRLFPYWSGWSKGFGLFSCSPASLDSVTKYIKNQKIHHAKLTFEEELKNALKVAGLPYDDKYLPGVRHFTTSTAR